MSQSQSAPHPDNHSHPQPPRCPAKAIPMKRSILALAIPLVLAAGGYRLITADAVAAEGAAHPSGEKVYLDNCAACHQPDGKGLAGAFPPLAKSDWIAGKTPAEVATTVLKGLEGEVGVSMVHPSR